ncbi:hypothetical protein D3C76_1619570 [compost metagenome]
MLKFPFATSLVADITSFSGFKKYFATGKVNIVPIIVLTTSPIINKAIGALPLPINNLYLSNIIIKILDKIAELTIIINTIIARAAFMVFNFFIHLSPPYIQDHAR